MAKDLKGKELGKGLCQRKNGTYSARYYDRFGKRQTLYNKNLADLKRELKTAKYDDENQVSLVSDKMTISKWFETWLSIHKYKVIRNSTLAGYRSVFKKHIEPSLGKRKLKEVQQLDIKALLKKIDKDGLGYETKRRVLIMLSDMYDKAMIDSYVLKNPCRGIKVVRDEEKEIRVMTKEEQSDFFYCCKGTFYDNLFVVAVTTGMRQGEICALTWDDIDLKNKEIAINKTLLYQKLDGDSGKTFHINPPKTRTSNRTIPITNRCEMALKKQFIQRNNIMNKSSAKPYEGFENLLFTTKYGTPLCDQNVIDAIRKIVDEINLCRDELEQFEYFSPHCFRHTFATRCFESGIQPKTVQQFLGHATLDMTMNLYTHVLESHKQEEIKKLEDELNKVFDDEDMFVDENFEKEINKKNKVVEMGVKRA